MIQAIASNTASLPLNTGPAPVDGRSFDAELQRQSDVREFARQFLSSALVRPIFQQMHESPWKSELFHGGFAEDTFNGMLDTHLADRVVRSLDSGDGLGLISKVTDKALNKSGPAAPAVEVDVRG